MSITSIDIVRSAVRAVASESVRPVVAKPRKRRPVVTISRASGIDPAPIAEGVRRILDAHRPTHDPPWLVYDRGLVQMVAEDHDLSADLVASLDEHDKSWFEHFTQGLKGKATGADVAMKMSRTIRALSRVGDAIIVGRGGQCVLQKLDHAVHIRLDAPLDWRVERYAAQQQVDESTARKALRDHDEDRARYVHAHFHRDIDDPSLYDLIINVARVDASAGAAAVSVVVEARVG